ncbi:MAG: hypothetical protein WAV40_01935 [Microgenomates group bacterium]
MTGTRFAYSFTLQLPKNRQSGTLTGLARRPESGDCFEVFLGDPLGEPDFKDVPDSQTAESMILAGDYNTALQILSEAQKKILKAKKKAIRDGNQAGA